MKNSISALNTKLNLNNLTNESDTQKIKDLKEEYVAMFSVGERENILAHGKSGSGKSATLAAIANLIGAEINEIQCSRWNNQTADEIHSWCQSATSNLNFFDAMETKPYTCRVVMLDEVEQVGTQGMEQLRGIINLYPEVIFFCTTNFIERMPAGFPNRFWVNDLWDGVDYREFQRNERLKRAKELIRAQK